MKTLTAKEIIAITKKNLPHGLVITGAENLKSWILINRLDNCGWLNVNSCHFAMKLMVEQGFLIKEKKNTFIRNPLNEIKKMLDKSPRV